MIVPIAHTSTGQVVVSIQMIILFKVQQIIMTTVTCYVIDLFKGILLPLIMMCKTCSSLQDDSLCCVNSLRYQDTSCKI